MPIPHTFIMNHSQLIKDIRLGLVIVLRRISDYGYITAPL